MNRSSADFLATAKVVLGNPYMSDRELGDRLGGFSQPMIGKAKAGNMSDPLATAVGRLLETNGVDDPNFECTRCWAEPDFFRLPDTSTKESTECNDAFT